MTKNIRPNTKYNRIYGKSSYALAKELNCTTSNISYHHKMGHLKYLEIASKNSFESIDIRIRKLVDNLKSRCENINDIKYKFYGGKGIKNLLSVYDIVYLWERDNASQMLQPSIDRKDNNKDYFVGNCQFIEMEENRKKRNYLKKEKQ